jgi:hypothetical protein
MKTIDKVSQEIQTAKEKYGPFNSTHEVYGVLKEEVDEFWDEVKIKSFSPDWSEEITNNQLLEKKKSMIDELSQIAAISLRAIDELEHNQIRWV